MNAVEAKKLSDHVLWLLDCESAHVGFMAAVSDLPVKLRGAKVKGIAHSPWQVIEHMRIAQRDILDYCLSPGHVSPRFPQEYWPARTAPPSAAAWQKSIVQFRTDLKAVMRLVRRNAPKLMEPIRHAPEVTLLTEALLVADHNAYHLGQLVALRRALGAWDAPPGI